MQNFWQSEGLNLGWLLKLQIEDESVQNWLGQAQIVEGQVALINVLVCPIGWRSCILCCGNAGLLIVIEARRHVSLLIATNGHLFLVSWRDVVHCSTG